MLWPRLFQQSDKSEKSDRSHWKGVIFLPIRNFLQIVWEDKEAGCGRTILTPHSIIIHHFWILPPPEMYLEFKSDIWIRSCSSNSLIVSWKRKVGLDIWRDCSVQSETLVSRNWLFIANGYTGKGSAFFRGSSLKNLRSNGDSVGELTFSVLWSTTCKSTNIPIRLSCTRV